MCGIFGYIGTNHRAADIVLNGIKTLEYRGYDSWGIAEVIEQPIHQNSKVTNNDSTSKESQIVVKKAVGKIGTVTTHDLPDSTLAIGHTRWATHGGVTEINSHPHLDCTGSIAIIHNGIVENYAELKTHLQQAGHTFVSETDSEIIAHCIEEFSKKEPFIQAFTHAYTSLKGFNAVIAISKNEEKILAVRNGSPLVVGFGNGEQFLASDASALLPYTREVYFLHDGEIAILTAGAIGVFNPDQQTTTPLQSTRIEWTSQSADRGIYADFMSKEIHEQPKILGEIAENGVPDAHRMAELIIASLGSYLIGCGSAYYTALAGTYFLSKIAHRHINATLASESMYQEDFLTPKSLMIALSQSGETMDTLEALRTAKKKGAMSAAYVNAIGSSMSREVSLTIPIGAGPEKSVASTKAVTGKLAHLLLLAYTLAHKESDGVKLVQQAVVAVEHLFEPAMHDTIDQVTQTLLQHEHVYIIGRGLSYPASLETAMKLKEISYIHAEGLAAGELKHGSLSLITKGVPCIVFLPDDETYGSTLSNAMELKARGGYVIGISHVRHELFDSYIHVPNIKEATIIPNIVVGQLLAYALTKKRHLDPDMPRNLAKSVTVK